jgi:type II secretory pathway component PulF
MSKVFIVKGIDPGGRIAEFVVIADADADARTKAQEAGLKHVIVRESKAGEPPAAPGESNNEQC